MKNLWIEGARDENERKMEKEERGEERERMWRWWWPTTPIVVLGRHLFLSEQGRGVYLALCQTRASQSGLRLRWYQEGNVLSLKAYRTQVRILGRPLCDASV